MGWLLGAGKTDKLPEMYHLGFAPPPHSKILWVVGWTRSKNHGILGGKDVKGSCLATQQRPRSPPPNSSLCLKAHASSLVYSSNLVEHPPGMVLLWGPDRNKLITFPALREIAGSGVGRGGQQECQQLHRNKQICKLWGVGSNK